MINKVWQGDCLKLMRDIPDKSIDLICCDLPYGTTQNTWDSIIPFEKLWESYTRTIKYNGAIILFGSEPFTSLLICSNLNMFKYNWIWQKNKTTGFFNAKKQPLNDNETISVFCKGQSIYNPQMTIAEKIYKRGFVKEKKSDNYGNEKDFIQIDSGYRYPKRIQYFNNNDTLNQLHPTQKPTPLCEYLIKTYTNPGALVLDNCAGSGTTAIACLNTDRRYLCIEQEEKYVEIINNRINDWYIENL